MTSKNKQKHLHQTLVPPTGTRGRRRPPCTMRPVWVHSNPVSRPVETWEGVGTEESSRQGRPSRVPRPPLLHPGSTSTSWVAGGGEQCPHLGGHTADVGITTKTKTSWVRWRRSVFLYYRYRGCNSGVNKLRRYLSRDSAGQVRHQGRGLTRRERRRSGRRGPDLVRGPGRCRRVSGVVSSKDPSVDLWSGRTEDQRPEGSYPGVANVHTTVPVRSRPGNGRPVSTGPREWGEGSGGRSGSHGGGWLVGDTRRGGPRGGTDARSEAPR